MAGVTPDRVLDAVEAVMVRGWEWGCADCAMAAGDVFLRLWGVDPMARLRGRWATALEAARVASEAGGMERLFHPEFEALGLAFSAETAGAIGLGHVPETVFGGRAMMICIEPGAWAGKTERGFAVQSVNMEGWICRKQ